MYNRNLDIQGSGMTSQRTRDRLVQLLRSKGIEDEAVLHMISKIPRHLFVDEALSIRAYENNALPIGYGQTISQPYIVARMTELALKTERPLTKVLEVGTGSGYQAAVLAPFVKELYTVERIKPLYENTKQLLRDLGYRNIRTLLSDGSWGLAKEAPFDAIVVTAAPEQVPEVLLEQLAEGGRLIIPVGQQGTQQLLQVITRYPEQHYETVTYEPVQFVPLIRDKN
ncbi:MAG: protein-L-isoaspartate(D-aspartate) O-methyltransferase [Thiofilum sp.]|uniref:protein-L-isoaspartate(D-aspartate) O-methyltransferase n=1 Tax=Thiofilum sp. TaxID=2212733 RepID=UPI0025CFB1A0|nr:protein-L-isoaspartate(D-aspartate) O-methyltransferase [Thiofilum sp.]MBK8452322.1 protein-L-isoaspartate(D-aspartate) O-methyltransferase [Thiofilum sp.]